MTENLLRHCCGCDNYFIMDTFPILGTDYYGKPYRLDSEMVYESTCCAVTINNVKQKKFLCNECRALKKESIRIDPTPQDIKDGYSYHQYKICPFCKNRNY